MSKINRRDFLKFGITTGSILALGNGKDLVTKVFGQTDTPKKIIILGLDGLDPNLLKLWMDAGKLPAFSRLRSEGSFSHLRTSIPPQSPVAWSNFITGTNPGGHGIFDFIHRDPENYMAIFSASKTSETTKTLSIGNVVLPISGGKVENLRKGKALSWIDDARIKKVNIFNFRKRLFLILFM